MCFLAMAVVLVIRWGVYRIADVHNLFISKRWIAYAGHLLVISATSDLNMAGTDGRTMLIWQMLLSSHIRH
jgi:hypothetical protein